MRHYSFKPGRASVLGTLLLLPLFWSLGVWQLHRAEEKDSLIELRKTRAESAELMLDGASPPIDELRYRSVLIRGHYDSAHQFLLDNQILDRQVGYHVLTPLRLEGSDLHVLVNRGWVRAPAERTQLPEVSVVEDPVQIRGTVDRFPSVGLRLAGAEIPASGWPAVVQVLDARALSERLGYPLLPYQVLLGPSQPEGYARNWKLAEVDPGKHLGYALQWFCFAAVLLLLFLWHGFKPSSGSGRSLRSSKPK
jgi:surfeit locus 1 family protein